jgi:uncharacterized protein YodC (DUF2158 family)
VPQQSTFTQEVADTICNRLLEGESLTHICTDSTLPNKPCILKWLRDFPEFATQYAHAREMQMELMATEIIDISEEEPMMTITFGENGSKECIDNAGIQRNRLRVDTRKWLMSKLAPKKYGEKVQQEVTGANGGPLQLITDIPRPQRD